MEDKLTLGVAARLSAYLRILTQADKQGKHSVSSQAISEYANVNSTQVRRDLSSFGKFGKRGVGYNIPELIAEIKSLLRTAQTYNIALVGAGRLGTAVATSDIFKEHGFRIVCIFDSDPEKIGRPVDGVPVLPVAEATEVCREKGVVLGVIAVPPGEAQEAAAILVRGGVHILFNYTEALLDVPEGVVVHTFNPAEEMLCALYSYLT